MYNPSHYRTTDDELIFKIVTERGFGALITPGSEGLSITHLPVAVDESSKRVTEVWGHVARANPHWQSWQPGVRSTLIIEGGDAYVSPAWYVSEREGDVPTWNYVAVHLTGEIEILNDPAEALATLRYMVGQVEPRRGAGWTIDQLSSTQLSSLMQAIVLFRLRVDAIDGKLKLSQSKSVVDRQSVIAHLESRGGDANRNIAAWMSRGLAARRPA